MKIEDIRNDEAQDTTEAAEELAADDYEPYTDEERAAMSPEQRAEVERIEQAIEEFLSSHENVPPNARESKGYPSIPRRS